MSDGIIDARSIVKVRLVVLIHLLIVDAEDCSQSCPYYAYTTLVELRDRLKT